jgi:gluconokinase
MTAMRPLVVVMTGVAGTGKTVIGRLVAQELGWPFVDGDDLHSAENVAKMRSGHPLTDAERGPWLRRVARWIGERAAAGTGGVIACSALRRQYRDLLRDGHPDVRFACLTADHDVLAARLAHRPSHFMPASLLDSQLAAFEPLQPDEPGTSFDTSGTPEHTAAAVIAALDDPP